MFTDTERAGIASAIPYKLATKVITPSCFTMEIGKKHVRYEGYQELAYLHPKYFKPNPRLLEPEGVTEDENMFFVRFTSFKASHDVSQSGFTLDEKIKLVKLLASKGKVVISSEGGLPQELEKYRMRGPASNVHHLLSFAKIFIGDSQTMATEAGLLGTPSIRCNSLVGSHHGSGNFRELQNRYGLVYSFRSSVDAFKTIELMLQNPDLSEEWDAKREILLQEKGDVVQQITEYIEDYLSLYQSL